MNPKGLDEPSIFNFSNNNILEFIYISLIKKYKVNISVRILEISKSFIKVYHIKLLFPKNGTTTEFKFLEISKFKIWWYFMILN